LGPYLRRVSDEIIDVATLQTEELTKTIEVPLIAAPGRERFEAIMSLQESMASSSDEAQGDNFSESLTPPSPTPEGESE
jgi:hypothetical protein